MDDKIEKLIEEVVKYIPYLYMVKRVRPDKEKNPGTR